MADAPRDNGLTEGQAAARRLVALGAAGVRNLSKSGSLSDAEKEMTRDASTHCAAQLAKS